MKSLRDFPNDFYCSKWYWSGLEFSPPCFFGGDNVLFLNLQKHLKDETCWNNTSVDKLWLYNLHYFDDLNCIDSLSRKDMQFRLVKRWIAENPAATGNGWEPYPLSLRLVNWIKWYSRAEIDDQTVINSIALQSKALTKQLEYHIQGNHLFANAKALVFVGCFLKGDFADKCLKLGLSILDKELSEQFLRDGGHFELSPMYHGILLYDLLDLINLSRCSNNSALSDVEVVWRQYASRGLSWLNTMTHPDGEISFFNDSAFYIAASPDEIFNYANKLGVEFKVPSGLLTTNHATGYSRVQNDNYTLLFDHANVGPDYLPGHAHADSLSFEMSVGSQRIFVNSGTSLYGVSKERLRQRETAAHNTVVVAKQNSSEVWSGFRVARRAYSKLLKAEQNTNGILLSAKHNGYERLKPKVIHTRTINALVDSLIITDDLSFKTDATFNLHLHPDVEVKQVDDFTLELRFSCDSKVVLVSSHASYVEGSTWHPEFGKSIPNNKIIIPFTNGTLKTEINIIKE